MKKLLSGRPALVLAVVLTFPVVLGLFFCHPSPMREAISGQFVEGVRLAYPWVYLVFAPFFHLADHFTILSMNQHVALLAFLNFSRILWRWAIFVRKRFRSRMLIGEAVRTILFNVIYALAAAAVILVPRPMARLEVRDPDLLVFDAHSHTSHSWDGRKSFTPKRNLRWHRKAGFHAAFITDHNLVTASAEARDLFLKGRAKTILPLPGEEVSLQSCHLAVLGNRAVIRNGLYDGSLEGIETFLGLMRSSDALVIASLPEYWKFHWDRREDFLKWGVRGFEIVNSAPLALDFPLSKRADMIEFCRKNRLIMTGITDTHGWGSTAYVWNVSRIPGWRSMSLDEVLAALLSRLKAERDQAVQIFVRTKAEPPENPLWLCADPLLQIWEMARSLPRSHAASFLLWIWAPAIFLRKNRDHE